MTPSLAAIKRVREGGGGGQNTKKNLQKNGQKFSILASVPKYKSLEISVKFLLLNGLYEENHRKFQWFSKYKRQVNVLQYIKVFFL